MTVKQYTLVNSNTHCKIPITAMYNMSIAKL